MSEQHETEGRPKRRVAWPLSRQRMIEMAVVVFGVMIALGFENLVQEIRLRGDAHEMERAFREDINNAIALSWERQAVTPCLAQTLSSLAERLTTPGGAADAAPEQGGSFAFAMPQPYRVPIRLWTTYTFDRALGSEAFKRIPRERADAYAVLFAHIEARREENAVEFSGIASLAPLAFPQPDMNAEVRAQLLQSLALLDRNQALAALSSNQLIRNALTLPGGDDIRAEILADRASFDEQGADLKASYGDCVDLGATDRLMAMARS